MRIPTMALSILAAGLIAGGGLAAAPAAAQETEENPFTATIDVRMGERMFRAQCGRCHGRDARGNDETGAPDLTTGQFSRASSDAGMFDVIRNGIENTAMIGISSRASDQNVWQIVSYITSLNFDPSDYDLPGDAARGAQVYEAENCSQCHMVNGDGGRLGPDLSDIGGRLTPDEIRIALTDPNDEVEPRWWTMQITREDGSRIDGLRMNEDTFSVRIMDNDERLWQFLKSQVRSVERVTDSTMAAVGVSGQQLDDLVAYVFTLRKEDN